MEFSRSGTGCNFLGLKHVTIAIHRIPLLRRKGFARRHWRSTLWWVLTSFQAPRVAIIRVAHMRRNLTTCRPLECLTVALRRDAIPVSHVRHVCRISDGSISALQGTSRTPCCILRHVSAIEHFFRNVLLARSKTKVR